MGRLFRSKIERAIGVLYEQNSSNVSEHFLVLPLQTNRWTLGTTVCSTATTGPRQQSCTTAYRTQTQKFSQKFDIWDSSVIYRKDDLNYDPFRNSVPLT
jgi:hypothetical protein